MLFIYLITTILSTFSVLTNLVFGDFQSVIAGCVLTIVIGYHFLILNSIHKRFWHEYQSGLLSGPSIIPRHESNSPQKYDCFMNQTLSPVDFVASDKAPLMTK